jgi:hypothetical protein
VLDSEDGSVRVLEVEKRMGVGCTVSRGLTCAVQ